MQTCRERSLDIAKNTLDEGEVRFTWVMHEQTHLLDRISQVRPCEGQILQRTSEAAVLRGVGEGGSSSADSLDLESTGVEVGWHSDMPARWRSSTAYWRWERNRPLVERVTEMPRKW
jgi:hypothetical protein